VYTSNTEDIFGADEFYVIGGANDYFGNYKWVQQPGYTSIKAGQTLFFDPNFYTIFDAVVPSDRQIGVGLLAYDEDAGKDWNLYKDQVNGIGQKAAAALAGISTAGSLAAFAAPLVIGLLVTSDIDDQLGALRLDIPASGPTSELKEWQFSHSDWTGYSSWNYVLRYRVTRTAG
jgi:hypothetical protein